MNRKKGLSSPSVPAPFFILIDNRLQRIAAIFVDL